jgi:predicted TIM-barrel fold metal-dependent hydrolase
VGGLEKKDLRNGVLLMIIDAHVHSGELKGCGTEDMLRLADRAGFDRIFCTDWMALSYDMYEGNRRLAEDMKRHPDRIIGYCTIPSHHFGHKAVDEVQRCYEVYGMRGLKVWHQTAGIGSYSQLTSINEPQMIPIFEKAAELGMLILAHSTPEECMGLSQAVPEAKLLMAQSGGCPTALGDWHKAIEAARQYPNILLDTSSSQSDMGYLEAIVDAVGAERVIFGTDMPFIDPFFGLAKVSGAKLTAGQKKLILGGNVRRLLDVSSRDSIPAMQVGISIPTRSSKNE